MKRVPWLLLLASLALLLAACGTGGVRTAREVQRISAADAKALQDAGEAVLYDVRSAAAYQELHADGARSFPEADLAANFDELETDKALIFY